MYTGERNYHNSSSGAGVAIAILIPFLFVGLLVPMMLITDKKEEPKKVEPKSTDMYGVYWDSENPKYKELVEKYCGDIRPKHNSAIFLDEEHTKFYKCSNW